MRKLQNRKCTNRMNKTIEVSPRNLINYRSDGLSPDDVAHHHHLRGRQRGTAKTTESVVIVDSDHQQYLLMLFLYVSVQLRVEFIEPDLYTSNWSRSYRCSRWSSAKGHARVFIFEFLHLQCCFLMPFVCSWNGKVDITSGTKDTCKGVDQYSRRDYVGSAEYVTKIRSTLA